MLGINLLDEVIAKRLLYVVLFTNDYIIIFYSYGFARVSLTTFALASIKLWRIFTAESLKLIERCSNYCMKYRPIKIVGEF